MESKALLLHLLVKAISTEVSPNHIYFHRPIRPSLRHGLHIAAIVDCCIRCGGPQGDKNRKRGGERL